jgi:hypothetical protein
LKHKVEEQLKSEKTEHEKTHNEFNKEKENRMNLEKNLHNEQE